MKVLKDYKHVQRIRKRGHPGEFRHYLRKGLGRPKRVTLPGKPGSPEWDAAYYGGFVALPSTKSNAPRGSLAWAIDLFQGHPDYTRRKASVRQKHDRHYKRIRAEHGQRLLLQMKTDHVKTLFSEVGSTRGINAANQWLDAVRDLTKWAFQQGMIRTNIAARELIDKFDREGEGHRCWTLDEVAAFRRYWPMGSRPRLVLELILALAFRRSDVIRVGASQVTPRRPGDADNIVGWLTYVQWKNRDTVSKRTQQKGITLTVPITRELQAHIDAARGAEKVVRLGKTPRHKLPFVLTDTGRAYEKDDSASDWFKGACALAGLPDDCVLHGLRKRSCSSMIDQGKTPDEVRAISGHQSYQQLMVYIAARNQQGLAARAIAA